MKNVPNFSDARRKIKTGESFDMYVYIFGKAMIFPVSELLRKNPHALDTHHPLRLSIKAPLPNPKDVPLMGVISDKDYVVSNAVEVIIAPPRSRRTSNVDYLSKPDYGKIPKYMKKIRRELEGEKRRDEQLMHEREEATKAKRRLLNMDERRNLVIALKARWGKVNQEYQQITHMTVLDTLSKVKRKERYEKMLEQIEKDISLMDRPESFEIYVDLEC